MIVTLPSMDTVRRFSVGKARMLQSAYRRSTLQTIRARIFGAAAHGEIVQIHGSINDQVHTVVGQCRAAGCAVAPIKIRDRVVTLDSEEQFLADENRRMRQMDDHIEED